MFFSDTTPNTSFPGFHEPATPVYSRSLSNKSFTILPICSPYNSLYKQRQLSAKRQSYPFRITPPTAAKKTLTKIAKNIKNYMNNSPLSFKNWASTYSWQGMCTCMNEVNNYVMASVKFALGRSTMEFINFGKDQSAPFSWSREPEAMTTSLKLTRSVKFLPFSITAVL